MHRRATVLVLTLVLGLTGACTTAPDAEGPPAGWVRVASDAGDLDVTLPPWLVAFETGGAIFANEVLADGTPGLQLLAEGPRTAELQPDADEPLEAWLAGRIESSGAGARRVESVRLPAGEAVVIRREDRPGAAFAWRIAAWAIRTGDGVAFLMVDGPPNRWAGREADVERIARLIRAPVSPAAPATP
jgi:hypothetical protein